MKHWKDNKPVKPVASGGVVRAAEATPLAIETRGLSKSYKGVEALKSLDLKVPKNSIFGFLGPNGAGKSTTIKLLLGLVKPTAGSGSVFGHDIVEDSLEIRRRVGYLAQDPRYYGRMTARQILRFAARFFYSGPDKAVEGRIAETLALVGLEDNADRPVKGFSGGERQRLGVAQAWINSPELLILDEPAASLDPMGRRDVLRVIERLQEYATVFYSTHILEDVERVSDTVAIVNHGVLIAQAPIEKLLAGSAPVYELVLKGNAAIARSRIRGQPWVSSLEEVLSTDETRFLVGVSNEAAAEERLLPLVLNCEGLRVTGFGRKKRSLEEAFMGLVEGGDKDEG
jgi:ABC-2 type transport system ATP-binding protein